MTTIREQLDAAVAEHLAVIEADIEASKAKGSTEEGTRLSYQLKGLLERKVRALDLARGLELREQANDALVNESNTRIVKLNAEHAAWMRENDLRIENSEAYARTQVLEIKRCEVAIENYVENANQLKSINAIIDARLPKVGAGRGADYEDVGF